MCIAEMWTKKKKILTRKERFKITISLDEHQEASVEKLQIEKEEFYQQLQAEEKQQEAHIRQEYDNRISSLNFICKRFNSYQEIMISSENRARNNSVRSRHPQLKNLNRIVPWMNQFVSEWRDCDEDGKQQRMKSIAQIENCIGFLNTLNIYLDNPMDIENLEIWHECKQNVRRQLYENIDAASYNVLSNIEREMGYLNAEVMYYKHKCEFYIHTIWTVLDKIRNAKDEKFILRCDFEDSGVTVHLPKSFSHKAFAVRNLVVLSDWHFTSDCRTATEFKLPQVWRPNLAEHVQKMWVRREMNREQMEQEKIAMRAEQEKRDIIMNKLKYLIPSSTSEPLNDDITPGSSTTETTDCGITDLNYLNRIIEMKKKFAEETRDEEKREIEDIKEYFKVKTEKYECNMRKYQIVGGIYHLNLVKQPPQPKQLKDGATLRMIIGKDSLQMWSYSENYEPPTAGSGFVKQPTDNDDEDVENTPEGALLAKLILVVMKLPDHVLWFDAPVPVSWDDEEEYWSTQHIYEVKFNEEKQSLSFRAGRMTTFGLAVFKFNNLPFQSWELKRCSSSSTNEVTFVLTTAILALEFIIRADEVTLTMLENANTSALQEIVGVPHKPQTLLKLLRTGGVNIFPSIDAFQYIEGVQIKHHVTENHLYHCMALLCLSYQFSWSRWNLMSGYKRFVLQLRDLDAEKSQNELLLVTDQQAFITDYPDVNQAFAECENLETKGRIFQPDLLSLAMNREGERFRAILDNIDVVFVETVYLMLSQTKVLSYS